ncbi:energy-coupling factor ABC transporter ATP-binding protein [Martelella radicis]|uniref:Cobalt/nickel transport system ATP-binding protein n=1 Tax=Martelella radicis TaxID=1397476 RepID=A0A7W6P8E2_9HYPH|nr:ABC transporter ATP-binding protein [Martelella radicis]MBB4120251.1 cobalt/nickel transport system ATP-binding protein [Martelella radicis]
MAALISARSVIVCRDGRPVLTEADLSLEPLERLAVVGPNGAGKTTLLRALVGLELLSSGGIEAFGEACRGEAGFRKARRRIGFLFQDSDDQLFCPTVLEDVSFGPLNLGLTRAESAERAGKTLAELGLSHLADRLTHKLSGGEKRLVCLAGLLAMGPDVLLLDEPTNGVDAENGARLEDALRAFEGAMILVSHDDAFVSRLATRGMLLRDGRLEPAVIHTHAHRHGHPHMHPRNEN